MPAYYIHYYMCLIKVPKIQETADKLLMDWLNEWIDWHKHTHSAHV